MKKIILAILLLFGTIVYSLPSDIFVVFKYNTSNSNYRAYICITNNYGNLTPTDCYGIVSSYPIITNSYIYTFPDFGVIQPSYSFLQMLGKLGTSTSYTVLNSYAIQPSFGLYPVNGSSVGMLLSGNSTLNIQYIGVGSFGGNVLYSIGPIFTLLYNVTTNQTNITPSTPTNITCAVPSLNIVSPSNGTVVTSGSTIDLIFTVNTSTGYVAYDIYVDNNLYISGIGISGTKIVSITLTGSGYKTIKVRAYYTCGSEIYEATKSITVFVSLPPKVWITSILPLANITNPIGYPVVNDNYIKVYYVLSVYNLSLTYMNCRIYVNLTKPAEISIGDTYREINKTLYIRGQQTSDVVTMNLTGMSEGLYDLVVSCSNGNIMASDSIKFLYAYNTSHSSLYCEALGGFFYNDNCCGDEPNENTPSQVSGYPNATYFNATTCSLEPIPIGKCLLDEDCPPPGWICINETYRGYAEYHCSINGSKINPTTFGNCLFNITTIQKCPSGTTCSYGICTSVPVQPYLKIGIAYPQEGESISLSNLTIGIKFYVLDPVSDRVHCKISINGNIVKESNYYTGTNITEFIPVYNGTNYLSIGCVDVQNLTNTTSVSFNVNTGVTFASSKECGIPYVCLTNTRSAVLRYYISSGLCKYDILSEKSASAGEHCLHGSIADDMYINPKEEIIGFICGPDAKSIYQVIYHKGGVDMYKIGEAKNRCVLGMDVSSSDLKYFNGMIIPVCSNNHTISVYKIVYDKSTNRIYYEQVKNITCNTTCIAGLCTNNFTISYPNIDIISIPNNVTLGSKANITLMVEDPYPTVYLEVYDIHGYTSDVVYKGVISTNVYNTITYSPKSASIHTLRFVVTDPLGISYAYNYNINVTSAPSVAPGGVPPGGVPSGIGIPSAAAISRELPFIIAALLVSAIGGLLAYYFVIRRR